MQDSVHSKSEIALFSIIVNNQRCARKKKNIVYYDRAETTIHAFQPLGSILFQKLTIFSKTILYKTIFFIHTYNTALNVLLSCFFSFISHFTISRIIFICIGIIGITSKFKFQKRIFASAFISHCLKV